jgi:hypothetical protein
VVAASALIAALTLAGTAGSAVHPSIIIENTQTVGITSTVAAIDYVKRTVTLTGPMGNKAVFRAGPEVPNFDQVHPGDTVAASYVLHEVVTTPSGRASPVREGNVATDTIQFPAQVEAVDLQGRTVWLRGPRDRDVHIAVAPETVGLERLHRGERVVYRASATLTALGSGPVAGSVKFGVLWCQLAPSVGLIVGSFQSMSCHFSPDNGGAPENYTGSINRIGLDLGITAGRQLAWAVYAPTRGLSPGGLAGAYVGASGDASLGVGVGANFLLGGSSNTVALQPFSVEGQIGLSLALGIANLQLVPAP